MKNLILLLVGVSLCVNALAQRPQTTHFAKAKAKAKTKQFQKSGVLVPQLYVSWNWDSPVDNWETDGDSTFKTYDALGNALTEIWVSSSPFGSFRSKTEYTYDNRGLETLSIRYNWNQGTSTWQEGSKTETYTSPNQDSVESVSYFKQNDNWIRSGAYLTVYEYNQQKLLSERSLDWVEHLNAYRNVSQTLYTYENDTLKTATYQSWDTLENVFINEEKYFDFEWYLWNGDLQTSLISELKGSEWDGDTWVLSLRNISSYDTKGELIEDVYEAYLDSAWVIEDASKYLITYNQDDVKIEDIEQVYNEGVYENNYKTAYSNFTLVNSLKQASSNSMIDVAVFPNPASSSIELTHSTVGAFDFNLYSIMGKLVFSSHSENKQIQLDRSALSAGMYTYQIRYANGQIGYGKLHLE
ncbi:MAG: T9SS type A sorting domain-containing protein [Bacteroidia bacterium]|jgi:hypothetical protein|nr:T9SS type A sorting domain-containing protein [Bacteroidia bacterium]